MVLWLKFADGSIMILNGMPIPLRYEWKRALLRLADPQKKGDFIRPSG